MFLLLDSVETVVQLSKGNISSQNVRVEFSLEDMDMSGFQEGAAYEEIQAWVREKYGFYATHLNIAKTKQKCGKTWGRSFCICPRVSFLTFETKGQKRKDRPCVSRNERTVPAFPPPFLGGYCVYGDKAALCRYRLFCFPGYKGFPDRQNEITIWSRNQAAGL